MMEKIFWAGFSILTLVMGIELAFSTRAYGGDPSAVMESRVETPKVVEAYVSSDTVHPVVSSSSENVPVFYNDSGKIYAISKVTKSPSGTTFKHLWFLRDQIILDAKVTLKSDQIKAVSGLLLKPTWTGKWRVDITSEDGTLLYSVPFVIQKKPAMEQASIEMSPSTQGNESGASHPVEKKSEFTPQ